MELASYLAGERWTDHPSCTHPLVASVARLVNDHTSDHARQRLATLVPDVIGLTSADLRVDALIVRRCAVVALPVVAPDRQRIIALFVLAAERVLDELDGRPAGTLSEESRAALAGAPQAAAWARNFEREIATSVTGFRRHGAPTAVRNAVLGIVHACAPYPDEILRDLLCAVIEEVASVVQPEPDREPFRGAGQLDVVGQLAGQP